LLSVFSHKTMVLDKTFSHKNLFFVKLIFPFHSPKTLV